MIIRINGLDACFLQLKFLKTYEWSWELGADILINLYDNAAISIRRIKYCGSNVIHHMTHCIPSVIEATKT